MNVTFRQATAIDLKDVADVLAEAERWLHHNDMSLWQMDELSLEVVKQDVTDGLYILVFVDEQPAGTFKYQHEDTLMWPDAKPGEAAYLHRLAVKREFAGGKLSPAMMDWALNQAKIDGYKYLRLDTDIKRPKLRDIYESFGFIYHSDHIVGPYHVTRYQIEV